MVNLSLLYRPTLLLGVTLAAAGQPYARDAAAQQPVAPGTIQPLQPLAPSPGGPTPGGPGHAPPPVYPQGPTAEQDSVRERDRPEFQPLGLELDSLLSEVGLVSRRAAADRRSALASFVVFPRLEFETGYDSNLFRSKQETSDTVFAVSPSVEIKSDWAVHALELAGAAKVGRHRRTASEDYEDFMGRASGRLDMTDDLALIGTVELGQTHQARGGLIDAGDTSSATVIEETKLHLGTTYRLAQLTLSGGINSEYFDYQSSATADNDDLDHAEHRATARASWEVDPGTSVFVQPRYNLRRYDRKTDSAGFEQDSHGMDILAGVRWDASGVTFAEFGIGYLRHDFDESRFSAINAPTASAKAIWNFTDLWTLTLDLSRTVSETADVDFSGVLNTRFKSRLDYEFRYNTIVSARFEYGDEDYRGSERSDERFIAGFGVKHLINQNFFAELRLDHERLSSSVDTEDFRVTTASLRLGTYI